VRQTLSYATPKMGHAPAGSTSTTFTVYVEASAKQVEPLPPDFNLPGVGGALAG
jgi:hypothetical protein